LTTSELIEMIRQTRIDTEAIEPAEFDDPYKRVSGAGILFGASGGVAEAALRMAVEKLTGNPLVDHLDFEGIRGFQGVKESTIEAAGKKVRVAVISGLNNVEPIAEKIINGEDVGYDLIEVMACPGGCICGAGHPVPEKVDSLENRQKVLVNIDKTSQYRKSQENPDVLRLYTDFYGEANSHLAHELLHTHYSEKKGDSSTTAIRRKSDSAFITHEFTVCTCDACVKKGSTELFSEISRRLHDLKMDSFVTITSIRMKDNHNGAGILLTLDGKRIDPDKLSNLYESVKAAEKT